MDYLLTKLYDNNLFRCVNVIFTADHGFASTPCEEKIYLADYIDLQDVVLEDSGPVARMYTTPGRSPYSSTAIQVFSRKSLFL